MARKEKKYPSGLKDRLRNMKKSGSGTNAIKVFFERESNTSMKFKKIFITRVHSSPS